MTITLTLEKTENILNFRQEILREDVVAMRYLSKLLGNLEAAFPAVTLGSFYYRASETDKAMALQQSNGNYNASVSSPQHIHVPEPDITIYNDSRTLGWAVTDGNNP